MRDLKARRNPEARAREWLGKLLAVEPVIVTADAAQQKTPHVRGTTSDAGYIP